MNAKHTPGPWTLMPLAGKDGMRYVWREAPYPGGECIARVSAAITSQDEKTLGYPWCDRQENAEANARLIAAAPELYEMLKAIDDRWREVNQPLPPHALITDRSETKGIADLVRQTIAKVEGE